MATSVNVDHIIIAVEDLEASEKTCGLLLGHKPGWRGQHPQYGTHNALFRLDNTYLELLAIDQRLQPANNWLVTALTNHLQANGEGLFGLVFGTDDLARLAEQMRKQGVSVSSPSAGYGSDFSGQHYRNWETITWKPAVARHIFSFAICHNSSVPAAEPVAEERVTGVDHLVIHSSDAQAARRFYRDILGIRLALERPWDDQTLLFFRTSHMSIEVMAADRFDRKRDRLWGLALRTDNLAGLRDRLLKSNIEVSEIRDGRKEGTLVCTVKSGSLGIPVLLIQHL